MPLGLTLASCNAMVLASSSVILPLFVAGLFEVVVDEALEVVDGF